MAVQPMRQMAPAVRRLFALEERLEIRIDRLPDRATAKTLRAEISLVASAIYSGCSVSTSCLETWSVLWKSSIVVRIRTGKEPIAPTPKIVSSIRIWNGTTEGHLHSIGSEQIRVKRLLARRSSLEMQQNESSIFAQAVSMVAEREKQQHDADQEQCYAKTIRSLDTDSGYRNHARKQ